MRRAAEANRLIMLRRWLTFALALTLVTVASLVLGVTIPAAAQTDSVLPSSTTGRPTSN